MKHYSVMHLEKFVILKTNRFSLGKKINNNHESLRVIFSVINGPKCAFLLKCRGVRAGQKQAESQVTSEGGGRI